MVFFAPKQQEKTPEMEVAEEVLEQITLPIDTVISSRELEEKYQQLVQQDEPIKPQEEKPKQIEIAQLKIQEENTAVIKKQSKQIVATSIEQQPKPIKAEVATIKGRNESKTVFAKEYAIKHKDQHTFKEVISVKQETVGSFRRIEELFKNL